MPNNEINMDVQGQGSASVSMNPSVDDAAFVGRAEAWAVGKRNGTDVPSTDPAYHNNAKYYATEAAASAADAQQYTAAAVHTWLENNVDPETGYVLDRTLSEKLAAAPADMVGDLKTAIGYEQLTFTNPSEKKYIATGDNVTTISTTPNIAESVQYCYCIESCSSGDSFTLFGQGGTAGRLWAFTDSSYNILYRAEASVLADGIRVTAPTNAAYIVVNFIGNGKAYKGELTVKHDFDEVKNTLLQPVSVLTREKIGKDWTRIVKTLTLRKYANTLIINGKQTSSSTTYYNWSIVKDTFVVKTGDIDNTLFNDNLKLFANRRYLLKMKIVSGNAVCDSDSNYINFRLFKKIGSTYSYENVALLTSSILSAGATDVYKYEINPAMDTIVAVGVLLRYNIQYNNLTIAYDIEDVTDLDENLYSVFDSSKFESGGFSSSTGKTADGTRIIIKTPVFLQKGTVLRSSLGNNLKWMIWELSSPSTSGGNVVAVKTWQNDPVYIIQNDCYAMIAVSKKNDGSISVSDFDGCSITTKANYTQEQINREATKKITKDDLVFGGFSSSDGYIGTYTRIRIRRTIFCEKGTKLRFSIGGLYWGVWELANEVWTSASDVLYAYTWHSTSEEYEVKNDCYLMLAFANASTSTASTDIYVGDFGDSYAQIVKPIGGSVRTIISDYIGLDDDIVTTKLKDYSGQMIGKSSIESFMFFTDSHWMNDTSWKYEFSSAVEKIGGVYEAAPVDFCLYGGDTLSNTQDSMTKEAAMYYLTLFDQTFKQTLGENNYYPLVGNHDYNYMANDELTQQDIDNAMYRRLGKAYFAIKGCNTTVYCLNTGKNKTAGGSYRVPMDDYKWEQIAWLGNALLTDDPAHSIIAMHIILNNDAGQPEFQMYTEANELCAAYNARQSITKNGVTYNFADESLHLTGKVEMFLGGHLHGDNFYGIKNNITYITRATAKSTISPTFDLVLCDWENGTALFKRFGTGDDALFDLSTGTIITDEE